MRQRRLDSVTLEVVRGQLQGIVEEMGELVMRCGHTVFIKETQDFVVAIMTPDGEVAACSQQTGIWIAIGLAFDTVIDQGGPYHPGDVWITNDPEQSGGLVTHLPDTFCWRPVFHDGELICFVGAFVHCTDVGGLVPGSVAPRATSQFEEGIVMPITRLVAGDEIQSPILDIYLRNSRIPEKNRGDILAMLGTLRRAETRIHHLLSKIDGPTFSDSLLDVLEYAEDQAAEVIADIPDGDHVFWDYLEGDLIPGGRPVRIMLTLRVRGNTMTLDFSGTDPQVAAAYNIPSYSRDGHYLLVLGVVNYMRTVKPDIVYNSGLVRSVKIEAERGCILNPEPHAAAGARQATFFRVADVVLGALAIARGDQVPAVGCGQGAIMLVSAPSLDGTARLVSIAQPLVGGSGARHHDDGTEGVDFTTGFYRNIPAEVLETEVPVIVEQYGLRPGSGGPGRTRGGAGLAYSLRFLTPATYITARGLERFEFQPWGRDGGDPGGSGGAWLEDPAGEEAYLGKIDLLEVPMGSVVRFDTAGGGGLGPAYERDPALVLRDVEDGLVPPAQAEQSFGVVIVDGVVDTRATEDARRVLKDAAPPAQPFAFGPKRAAHERQWPDLWQRAVNDATSHAPPMIRQHVRGQLTDACDAEGVTGRGWGEDRARRWLFERTESLLAQLDPFERSTIVEPVR
ncbi:MAG: hydantoinase B/oxoprolinase family protein [Nitriliruptorales bacterium]|nr:hydantoinase B/oxoprolinase family protein [Nitriliruptorales bacterium]